MNTALSIVTPSAKAYPAPSMRRFDKAAEPADSFEQPINLNDYIVRHPVSTFIVQIEHDDNIALGISSGDVVVVDRSLAPKEGSLLMIENEDGFVIRKLIRNRNGWSYESGSGSTESVHFEQDADYLIRGVITHIIHSCQ